MGVALTFLTINNKSAKVFAASSMIGRTAVEVDGGVGFLLRFISTGSLNVLSFG